MGQADAHLSDIFVRQTLAAKLDGVSRNAEDRTGLPGVDEFLAEKICVEYGEIDLRRELFIGSKHIFSIRQKRALDFDQTQQFI